MTAFSPNKPVFHPDESAEYYASCGSGLEHLLARELNDLGCQRVQVAGAGVRFFGDLRVAYRVCLWSRVANRVLLPLHRGPAADPDELYSLVREIEWSSHVDSHGTLAVDFFTANSAITHSQYGALKVKDAIVDQFRESVDHRPNIDRETPDLRVNVYLFRDKARVSVDLSGSSLHRRGYRISGGLAPLKENLAAALLLAADWPEYHERGLPFFDPLCGSGTLLTEAAMMATGMAPGLHRDYFGFLGWKHHDAGLWQQLTGDANNAVVTTQAPIVGADNNSDALAICRENIAAAGLEHAVELVSGDLQRGRPRQLDVCDAGLIVTNPPYGERLAAGSDFYASLGSALSHTCAGWRCLLFSAKAAGVKHTRLPLTQLLSVRNGGIDCVLYKANIPAMSAVAKNRTPNAQADVPQRPDVDIVPLRNRLKKNQRALANWLKQNDIQAYRLYDADLPEFAVAIDVFNANPTRCVVQEYKAPPTVNIMMAQARLDAAMGCLPEVLNIAPECIHLKHREIKSGDDQYRRLDSETTVLGTVKEFSAELEINFTDYLDVGLFLDHRPVRKHVMQNANGKRFLNLFSYTAAATVAAIAGGASESVSVDLSRRYCQWAVRNLQHNGAAENKHLVIRQDVRQWLESARVSLGKEQLFDMILLDPPTFSNSTDVEHDWSVQRDHIEMILACLDILAPGGLMIFSTNYRRFKLARDLLNDKAADLKVEDRSRWSIDRDFQRNPRIHQCWFISR
ncbi:MAG: bifunctional 23S rRNA (guanine(2069)-N(7))-methyltransferase RlmK/23S rRNA (guanine(2445)-N(2))-methyltransferase RlmL [Granulosicoccus sp.]